MNKQTAWGSCHSELTSWPRSAPRPPGGPQKPGWLGRAAGSLGARRGRGARDPDRPAVLDRCPQRHRGQERERA